MASSTSCILMATGNPDDLNDPVLIVHLLLLAHVALDIWALTPEARSAWTIEMHGSHGIFARISIVMQPFLSSLTLSSLSSCLHYFFLNLQTSHQSQLLCPSCLQPRLLQGAGEEESLTTA